MLLGTNGQPIQSEQSRKDHAVYWLGLRRALMDNIDKGTEELSKYKKEIQRDQKKRSYMIGRGDGAIRRVATARSSPAYRRGRRRP